MAELCLMASHGCAPGLGAGFLTEKASSKELHHFLPHHGSNQDLVNPLLFNLSQHQQDEWRPTNGLLDANHFLRIDSMSKRPAMIDFPDGRPDSVLFGFGIVEQCTMRDKILKLLASGSLEEEDPLVDLSMICNMTGPQSPEANLPKQPFSSCSRTRWCSDDAQTLQNLVYPTQELYFNEPYLELVGDGSERAYHPNGQLPCNRTSTEMNDILSVISNFHPSQNANKSSRQTILVPYFERRRRASAKTNASKLAIEKVMKSHDKPKKTPQKKKTTSTRAGKERVVYSNSYLHACESLLSIIANRKQQKSKDAIHSLKKSGPHLPLLLTQFSASIAGTGIAVVVSVLCRAACARVPFCASKLLSAGLGLGLVWLSWAVNRVRDTVIAISKASRKSGEREEEVMDHLDRNLKDVYFRAATLMAVAVLKVA